MSLREQSQSREPRWKRWLPHSGHSQIIHKLCPHCIPCMHYNSTSNNMIEKHKNKGCKKLFPQKLRRRGNRWESGRGCKQEVEKAWILILALFCSSLICFVFGFQVKVCDLSAIWRGCDLIHAKTNPHGKLLQRERLQLMWLFTYTFREQFQAHWVSYPGCEMNMSPQFLMTTMRKRWTSIIIAPKHHPIWLYERPERYTLS